MSKEGDGYRIEFGITEKENSVGYFIHSQL